MEIGNIHIPNAPHIQIDHRKEERDPDRLNFKDFLPNPDVSIVNRAEEVRDGTAIKAEVNENKIILNQFRTTHNIILGFKDAFMEEIHLLLGETGKAYLFQVDDDAPIRNEQLARMIPESFKKRVIAWAINYKLYVVVEMLNPDYTIEHKRQIRNIYLNDSKPIISYVFHDIHWSQVIDDIRDAIRTSEIDYYDKKLMTLKQKIVKIGETGTHNERIQTLRMVNRYITEFASNYYTGTFPINEHSMDRLKKLVQHINKTKSLHLEIV
jgi:hypothetical protein